jgi:hypothetical protein
MPDSIREALTAAVEKHSTPETENAATETPTTQAADDGTGSAANAAPTSDKPEAGSTPPGPEAAPSTEKPDGSSGAPAAPTPPPASNAPASWNAEERAAWQTVPEKARAAILRREGEMNRALQASSNARRRVEQMDQITNTYKPLLDSYGVTIEQVLPPLLATRAALEVGSPEQKATLVANLCADFGLDMNLLDQALGQRFANGQPTPRYQPQQLPDLTNHPQLAGLFAIAEQIKTKQTEQAVTAINEVSTLPHYEEVRFAMADLIEQARANGRSLDLKKAYAIACQLNGFEAPAAPASQVSVSEAAAVLARSRAAASSVTGAPKPTPARKPGEGTLRDELEANLAAAKR